MSPRDSVLKHYRCLGTRNQIRDTSLVLWNGYPRRGTSNLQRQKAGKVEFTLTFITEAQERHATAWTCKETANNKAGKVSTTPTMADSRQIRPNWWYPSTTEVPNRFKQVQKYFSVIVGCESELSHSPGTCKKQHRGRENSEMADPSHFPHNKSSQQQYPRQQSTETSSKRFLEAMEV